MRSGHLGKLFPHPIPLYMKSIMLRERKLNITFRKKERCGFIAEQKLKIRELEKETTY